MTEKVSIIIPCYNQEKYISDAIDSALNQTYKNVEIVIINDASTDNSRQIISEFAQKYKNIIFLNNEKNKGVVYSRNTAIEASSGSYILPLDGDDKIEPTYIEKAIKILKNNSNIGMVYCNVDRFGTKTKKWKNTKFEESTFLFGEHAIICGALFRKEDFNRFGKYKERMIYGYEDWDLWLTFYENGLKPYKIPEVLYHYRLTKNESRSDLVQKHSLEMYKELVKNHLDLYLNNEQTINKLFRNTTRKLKQFRRLFKATLIIAIIELLTLAIFLTHTLKV